MPTVYQPFLNNRDLGDHRKGIDQTKEATMTKSKKEKTPKSKKKTRKKRLPKKKLRN